ncbi:hypothetical protein [Candidatus Thiosymbion oneisti]|uniref:hypothetical protein n=1 Tax=Candidatus Thiosymbion oneisti TaxID=589554 RepID=UPI001414D7C0|nr:hypothetical protein [Candidatus Thiosymbion oneisti]
MIEQGFLTLPDELLQAVARHLDEATATVAPKRNRCFITHRTNDERRIYRIAML